MLSVYLAALDEPDNRETFENVYHKYKRLVYHTAIQVVGDPDTAEDVLQEVFLYVSKNFSRIYKGDGHEFTAYLVSCSRSRAYDLLRKQKDDLLPEQEEPDQVDETRIPENAAIDAESIERLRQKIALMKPIYRDPLRLLAMGYNNREIANALALTEETVRKRISRGRKLLWKELTEDEE